MIITRAFLRMLSDDEKLVNRADLPCDTMTINEFLFALNIDNINLVKLLQYVKESNIIYKVSTFLVIVIMCFIAPFCEFDN